MLQSGPEAWRKEVEDYEARMFDYFTQCSARLREWYGKGGEESEAYRAEYQRLSDEYQRYMNYIQQLHDFVMKSTGSSKDAVPVQNTTSQPAATNIVKPMTASAPISSTVPSTLSSAATPNGYQPTTAAAFYTQYYQEMIAYFDKLLKTIEQTHQNGNSSSNEDVDEEVDGKTTTERQLDEDVSEAEGDAVVSGDMCCNPRAVMEQYFERYGEPGKWDWASWNNYLSWIARTNPQWYGIFLEYSQTLGIDWDEMYKCWRLSDAAGQSDTSASGMAYSGHGVFPTELSHIRLFPNVPSHSDEEDNSTNEWFCRTCKIQLTTERAFTLHLRGVSHIQKALGEAQQQLPQQPTGWANYRPIMQQQQQMYTQPQPLPPQPYQNHQGYDEQLRHQAWLQSQYWQRNNTEFVVPGTLYCDLCKVNSATYGSLQAHLNGRRHRENVDIYYRTGEASMLKGKRGTHAKPTARLQTLLDTCTQPLIGLGYVVERQFGDEEDCVYLCELCDERITRQTAIKHVCDVLHRVNYMKLHYPDMCAIVVNDQSSRDIRLKRIDAFARKIEDFEGRKRVKVKQLSAFDALRRIWRPLACEEVEIPKRRRIVRRKVAPTVTRTAPAKKRKTLLPTPEQNSNTSTAVTDDLKPKENGISEEKEPGSVKTDDSDGELEEGEITEDSSDENISLDLSSRGAPHPGARNSQSALVTDAKDNGLINSGQFEQAEDNLDSTFESPEESSLLPESLLTFEPDAECSAYIESLRSGGFLQLGSAKTADPPSVEQTVAASDAEQQPAAPLATEQTKGESADSLSIEDQFAREADWVLERTRVQREQEEEYKRQSSTTANAAPNSNTSDAAGAYVMDDGCFADQEDNEMWFDQNDNDEMYAEEYASQSPTTQLLLPPLGTSFGPGPNAMSSSSDNPVSQTDHSTSQTLPITTTTASPSITSNTSSTGPMDPNRQRLAVSIGAVKIIVSALNALRDAGQLPGYLNTVFDKTGDQQVDDESAVAPNSTNVEHPIAGREAVTSRHGTTDGDHPSQPDPTEQKQIHTGTTTPAPVNHLNTASKSGPESLRSSNPMSKHPSRPTQEGGPRSGMHSPFIPIPSVGPNSSLLGPPGLNVPSGPPNQMAPPPPRPLIPPVSRVRPENQPSNRPIRLPHMLPLPNSSPMDRPPGGPRHPTPGPMVRPPPVRPPHQLAPPMGVRMDSMSDLPSKVASYIRSDSNGPSETMFDAYALFSRRGDERNRPGHIRPRMPAPPIPHQPSDRSRFGRPGPRGSARKENKKPTSGGRKLSAIADFLGVNEPPPAAPKPPPVPSDSQSSTVPVSISTSLSYLIPVSGFTQTSMPRISLYVPQMSTSALPTLRPTSSSLTPDISTGSLTQNSNIPTVYNATTLLPTITNKSNSSLLGAPVNLDEFLRKLRTT